MKTLIIGKKQINLEALKGISKTKFLKDGHGTEKEYEVLEPFVKVKTTKKKTTKKEEGN